MDIGRFYLRNRQFLAAVNRFKTVVEQYSSTTHVPEALARLTEAYTALGLRTEAHKTAAVLGYNFPGTDWYKEAFALAGGDSTPLLADVTPNGKPIITREAKNGQEAKAETQGTQP
jgi:outer membrane protein assembly factor BamD